MADETTLKMDCANYHPEQPLAPGVFLALYNGGRPDLAVTTKIAEALKSAQCNVVIHAGLLTLIDDDPKTPNEGVEPVAKRVRELVPAARISVGVGLTGTTNYLAAHPTDGEKTVRGWIRRLAEEIEQIGAESVMWDSEEAGKTHPSEGEETANITLDEMHKASPLTVQIFTSYGMPVHVKIDGKGTGGHAPFRFKPWLASPLLDLNAPQFYAVEGTSWITEGALRFAITAGTVSHQELVRAGLMRADLPQAVYLQFHHTDWRYLVNAAADFHTVYAWASDLLDANGSFALRVLAEMYRRGFAGSSGSVRRLQAALGFTGAKLDGRMGPVTVRALLGSDVTIPSPQT